jgi:antimicrobial peptide system SdpB family protein
MLALATATTLATNQASVLFAPASAAEPMAPACTGLRHASLYCAAPAHLDAVRLACVAGLLLVASGWRPRLTGVLHWWIAFSLQASATLLDGGDHITEVLTLLLLPVTLTDSRKWHWSPPPPRGASTPMGGWEEAKRIAALVSLTVVRLQVCGVYFHAAAGKFASDTWADGTSMYYWLTNSDFGAPQWLAPIVRPLIINPVPVALLTWSVVVLEFTLAAGIVMAKRHWRWLLWSGIALHAGIILIHGLVSFGIAMMAALVLYLRPIGEPWGLARIASLVRRRASIRAAEHRPLVASEA